MSSQRWHCYTSAYESTLSATVLAETAEEAALMAARSEGVGGLWIVTPGEPTEITIKEHTTFESVRP